MFGRLPHFPLRSPAGNRETSLIQGIILHGEEGAFLNWAPDVLMSIMKHIRNRYQSVPGRLACIPAFLFRSAKQFHNSNAYQAL
jgi:hypothetical protein